MRRFLRPGRLMRCGDQLLVFDTYQPVEIVDHEVFDTESGVSSARRVANFMIDKFIGPRLPIHGPG